MAASTGLGTERDAEPTARLDDVEAESASAPREEAPVAARTGWDRAFMVAVLIAAVFMVVGPLATPPRMPNDHYVYLARNLAQLRVTVDDLPRTYPDQIQLNGHVYLPLGPLPGALLVPLLPLFDFGLRLVWIGQLHTLLNIWLFYRVLARARLDAERRRWALLLFFGGTVYYSMAIQGASYFFAHLVTVTLVLLAMGEALGPRRPLLVGLFVGLACMTRFTAIFTLPFFAWLLWKGARSGERARGRGSARAFALAALGLVGPLALISAYNSARFGSPFESGYSLALLGVDAARKAREVGLFSLAHVPKNLFMMLLQGPLPWPSEDAPVLTFPYMWPSPWGMGLFFTSPALAYAFRGLRGRLRLPLAQALCLGIASVLLPVLTYYGIGYIQFGFRYALDFLPMLLVLAALGFPRPMTAAAKTLVLVSVAVCIWGSIFLLFWI